MREGMLPDVVYVITLLHLLRLAAGIIAFSNLDKNSNE